MLISATAMVDKSSIGKGIDTHFCHSIHVGEQIPSMSKSVLKLSTKFPPLFPSSSSPLIPGMDVSPVLQQVFHS